MFVDRRGTAEPQGQKLVRGAVETLGPQHYRTFPVEPQLKIMPLPSSTQGPDDRKALRGEWVVGWRACFQCA